MAKTDYYKILGVDKNASADQIKKAYRKLAMKYHPDHTGGTKESEEKFKEISEAYAVLSDPEKKKQYDTFGSEGFHQRYSQEDIFRNVDLGDILREFGFGGGSGSFFSFGTKGGGRRGGSHFSFDPETLFGGGGGRGRGQSASVKGRDLEYEIPLTLSEIAAGTQKTITVRNASGEAETLNVKIPKGMISGKKIRLGGRGEPSPYGGPSGDLFIRAKINDEPPFKSEGHDLYVEKEIKLTDALLGTKVEVPTISGKQLSLKIPAGTRHKSKLRLPGQGLPHMKGNGVGDLYVVVNVLIPRHLNKKQKQLIESLAEAGL